MQVVYVVLCGYCGQALEVAADNSPPMAVPRHTVATSEMACPGLGPNPVQRGQKVGDPRFVRQQEARFLQSC